MLASLPASSEEEDLPYAPVQMRFYSSNSYAFNGCHCVFLIVKVADRHLIIFLLLREYFLGFSAYFYPLLSYNLDVFLYM